MSTIRSARCRAALAALLLVARAAGAAGIDLVAHKSFEACWSQALSNEDYTALVNSVTEGQAGCIPASASLCSASMCDGVPGCPITLRKGSAAYVDAYDGSLRFDTTGGVDPLVIDVVVAGVPCTVTVFDASNIVSQAQLQISTYDDGNFGLYMANLISVNNVQVSGLRSTDFSISGDNLLCSAGGLVSATQIVDAIASGVQQALWDAEQSALGEAVCPPAQP